MEEALLPEEELLTEQACAIVGSGLAGKATSKSHRFRSLSLRSVKVAPTCVWVGWANDCCCVGGVGEGGGVVSCAGRSVVLVCVCWSARVWSYTDMCIAREGSDSVTRART